MAWKSEQNLVSCKIVFVKNVDKLNNFPVAIALTSLTSINIHSKDYTLEFLVDVVPVAVHNAN